MATIKLKSITIQNFLSFGNVPTTIELDTSLLTLILGHNKDVGSEGHSKNGCGKSTIFQAISWCLFNEGINNIKQDALINLTNKKQMSVNLDLEIDGESYSIIRSRKPTSCEIFKNGETFTLHSIKSTDEAIVSLIGIDHTTFMNAFMLSNNVKSFMNMSGVEQRAFIESLLSISTLTERANALKVLAKENTVDIRLEEQRIALEKSNNDNTKKNIDSLLKKESEWQLNHEKQLAEDKETLEQLLSVDIEEETRKADEKDRLSQERYSVINEFTILKNNITNEYKTKLNERLSDIKQQLNTIIQEKKDALAVLDATLSRDLHELEKTKSEHKESIGELVKTENELKLKLSNIVTEYNKLEKRITTIRNEIKSLKQGECPYCHQHYTSEETIKNLNDENDRLSSELNQLQETKEKASETISYVQQQIIKREKEFNAVFIEKKTLLDSNHRQERSDIVMKFSKKENDLSKVIPTIETEIKEELEQALKESKCRTDEKLSSIDGKISRLENVLSREEIGEIKTLVKQLTTSCADATSKKNPYSDQIESLKGSLKEIDESQLAHKKKLDNHYQILIKLLTDNKSFLRKNIIDQYLPFLNDTINGYLEQLECGHRVVINADLSVDIEYMNEVVSFGNLSNGERLRVNFASSLAFRDLLSLSGMKMNTLFLDEILDSGGDSGFLFNASKILKRKEGISTFLISHREELQTEVDRTMVVVKENGFSEIMNK